MSSSPASTKHKAEVWESLISAQRSIDERDLEIHCLREAIVACKKRLVDKGSEIECLQQQLAEKTDRIDRLQAQQLAEVETYGSEVVGHIIPQEKDPAQWAERLTSVSSEITHFETTRSSWPSGTEATNIVEPAAGVATAVNKDLLRLGLGHSKYCSILLGNNMAGSQLQAEEVNAAELSPLVRELGLGHGGAARFPVASVAIPTLAHCEVAGRRRPYVAFRIELHFDDAGDTQSTPESSISSTACGGDTQSTPGGSINSTACGVWRRYSEFRALKDSIGHRSEGQFPRKQRLPGMLCGLGMKQLEQRQSGLEAWLSSLVLDARRGLLPDEQLQSLIEFLGYVGPLWQPACSA